MKIKSLFLVILSLSIFLAMGCVMKENSLAHKNNVNSFEILFWSNENMSIEDLQALTFNQIIAKYSPQYIVSDQFIEKYYWDEQLIEFQCNSEQGYRCRNHFPGWGFFTIVLNNKIIYHGLERTLLPGPALKSKHSDSERDYPAIVLLDCKDQENAVLAIQPKLNRLMKTFRNYDGKEKNNLLNQEVLKYFLKQGKIVRGKIDLETTLSDHHNYEKIIIPPW